MNPAQHSRLEKEKFPDRYCANSRCLWRITNREGVVTSPCQKHPVVAAVDVEAELAQSRALARPYSVERADMLADSILFSLSLPDASGVP